MKCANKDITTNPNWKNMPGAGTYISLNDDGSLFYVNSVSQNMYYKHNITTNESKQVGGKGDTISGNSGFVCSTNRENSSIWCADQNIISLEPNWSRKNGGLEQVSVNNDGSVYGINGGGEVFYMSNYKTGQFQILPKGAIAKRIKTNI